MYMPNMRIVLHRRKALMYVYPEQSCGLWTGGREDGMTNFGEKIRDLRKKAGLTLDQLAERTASSKSYIWELENKNPPRPSADKITRIASVLGVTSDYLMAGEGDLQTAEDEAFYRKYRGLDPAVKERIRKMSNLIVGD